MSYFFSAAAATKPTPTTVFLDWVSKQGSILQAHVDAVDWELPSSPSSAYERVAPTAFEILFMSAPLLVWFFMSNSSTSSAVQTLSSASGMDAARKMWWKENTDIQNALKHYKESAAAMLGSSSSVEEISSAKDLATQLEPLFGSAAKWLMGLGLMAAGMSSALTAPLAAAYAAKGLFGWSDDETDIKFRSVWIAILLIGVVVSTLGVKSILIIKFAQITNATLLPFIAIYLLYISNSKKILSAYTNTIFSNVLGFIVILFTFLLSFKTMNSLFGFL